MGGGYIQCKERRYESGCGSGGHFAGGTKPVGDTELQTAEILNLQLQAG